MAKDKEYTKEEMKKIIDKAKKIEKYEDETYTQDDIEKIARNMNIPKRTLKKAFKLYNKNTSDKKKFSSNPKKRKIKLNIIYFLYTFFWLSFITVLILVPLLEETMSDKSRWGSAIWLIPSMAFVGLIMGAFINELEGAIIGVVAGGLMGLFILWLGQWLWGNILIGVIMGFIAFIVFLFRFKGQIDAVIK